jgi:hypothetical protein
MVPAIHLELSAQRVADLRRGAAKYRRARAAAANGAPSVRRRAGRGLIAAGAWLAGEGAIFDRMVATRGR